MRVRHSCPTCRRKLLTSCKKTANLTERAFDNVLNIYEQLGNKILPLYEYIRLFTGLPECEGCLVYIYRDVLTFHQVAYKLLSLRSKCEIEPSNSDDKH